MTDLPPLPDFRSPAEFWARALAIEVEASERYELLADQMEVHNNREVAEIFRKMAVIEGKHRDEITRRAAGVDLAGEAAKFGWTGPDGPESADFEEVHYLMSAHQALRIARHNEDRAARWFAAVAQKATDREIRALAAEFAEEERQHVAWVDGWLAKFPPPEPGWAEDPDPPVFSD